MQKHSNPKFYQKLLSHLITTPLPLIIITSPYPSRVSVSGETVGSITQPDVPYRGSKTRDKMVGKQFHSNSNCALEK